MQTPTLLLGGLVAASLLLATQPLRAQADACSMLKPAEVTALLGGTASSTPKPNACIWKAGDEGKKLTVNKLKATGTSAEMAFMGARQGASHGGKTPVTDEPGLGDKAFSSLTSFGVALVVLKQGRVLQMAYYTGGEGTAKDQEALRPVAKQAVAAF
jgi:hypothetical protein